MMVRFAVCSHYAVLSFCVWRLLLNVVYQVPNQLYCTWQVYYMIAGSWEICDSDLSLRPCAPVASCITVRAMEFACTTVNGYLAIWPLTTVHRRTNMVPRPSYKWRCFLG